LSPKAAVIVATARALKMNGGVPKDALTAENVAAVTAGAVNLARHIENVRGFGVPVVVAINHFTSDTPAELAAIEAAAARAGGRVVLCRHWAEGSKGAEDLARAVVELVGSGAAKFHPIYPDAMPLKAKVETVAEKVYRAARVDFSLAADRALASFEKLGFGHLPVCMAKTQMSFSDDPSRLGAPEGHVLHVREARLAAGAGFVVAICGEIMTMPGLPKVPAAERIGVNDRGEIDGLF
jgi:formate--tetrahydrofolate ligase